MFWHPMSIAGYVFAALAVAGGFSRSCIPHDIKDWLDAIVPLLGIVGFCTVFLGVIARGFERVEAAILSSKDGRNGQGGPTFN